MNEETVVTQCLRCLKDFRHAELSLHSPLLSYFCPECKATVRPLYDEDGIPRLSFWERLQVRANLFAAERIYRSAFERNEHRFRERQNKKALTARS
jgi:DNA-directed RNA polymerase subunit RPC12/RpoP